MLPYIYTRISGPRFARPSILPFWPYPAIWSLNLPESHLTYIIRYMKASHFDLTLRLSSSRTHSETERHIYIYI